MTPEELRPEEFLRRVNQLAVNDASDAAGGLLFIFGLLVIGACLFGVAYMISLGWHMGAT